MGNEENSTEKFTQQVTRWLMSEESVHEACDFLRKYGDEYIIKTKTDKGGFNEYAAFRKPVVKESNVY